MRRSGNGARRQQNDQNTEWSRRDAGSVKKLEIGGSSVYLTIGFSDVRPVWISLTLGHEVDHPRADEDRTLIEVICNQASVLLSTGTWTIEDLVNCWAGVRNYEPSGSCPQIKSFAQSPLDAAAKWLRKEFELEE